MPLLKQILLVMTYQKDKGVPCRARPPEVIHSNSSRISHTSILSYTVTTMDYHKFGLTVFDGIGSLYTGIYIDTRLPFVQFPGHQGRRMGGGMGGDTRAGVGIRQRCVPHVKQGEAFQMFKKYKRNVYIVVSRIMECPKNSDDPCEEDALNTTQKTTLACNVWQCTDEPDVLESKCILPAQDDRDVFI